MIVCYTVEGLILYLVPDGGIRTVITGREIKAQKIQKNLLTIQRAVIKKMWSMYTMEYSSAIRKNKYPPFASTWMELEGIMLSEVIRRRTIIIWFHSCGEYKK